MSTIADRFRASNAIAYVDAYRRFLSQSPRILEGEIRRLEDQISEMEVVPPRIWAELRACEHAHAYLAKNEEPTQVIIGPPRGDMVDAVELQDKLNTCRHTVHALESSVSQAKKKVETLDGEIIQLNHTIGRLQHRIQHSQSTIQVLGGTLAVIIAAALIWLVVT